jgi:cytochrome b subunit of formate dehydrogenase
VLVGRSSFGHLHGPFAFLTTALVVGPIFMAVVNPSTRPALRGMIYGSVDREWATHHFPRWMEEMDRASQETVNPKRPPLLSE